VSYQTAVGPDPVVRVGPIACVAYRGQWLRPRPATPRKGTPRDATIHGRRHPAHQIRTDQSCHTETGISSDHNLHDYGVPRGSFDWQDIYDEADWDEPDRLNIAHETCDRRAENREKVAFYYPGSDGERETLILRELPEWLNLFANVLDHLTGWGDCVIAYCRGRPNTTSR
jgi:hypothetical protein